MTKVQSFAFSILLTGLFVQWSSAQETALEKLQERGAKIYYELDAEGKPTAKLRGIGIPFDWMGNDYSLDLIRDIPRGEGEQLYLRLYGPTTISKAKIDELKKIPGWTVTRSPAVFLGVGTDQSFAVTAILPGSAAELCGVKKGDTILKLNDSVVSDVKSVSEALLDFKPGDEVTITFTQDGIEKTAIAKLTARPEPGTRIEINNRSP